MVSKDDDLRLLEIIPIIEEHLPTFQQFFLHYVLLISAVLKRIWKLSQKKILSYDFECSYMKSLLNILRVHYNGILALHKFYFL